MIKSESIVEQEFTQCFNGTAEVKNWCGASETRRPSNSLTGDVLFYLRTANEARIEAEGK